MNHLSKEAEQSLKLAKDIAREYGLGYVGTEHLLLAIVREGASLGAEILRKHGANEYTTQAMVDELVKDRIAETWIVGRLPGTPHFKDVITQAATEARGTGNWKVSSEHLLLALLAEKKSLGCKALEGLGLSPAIVRHAMTAQKTAATDFPR